MRTIDQQIAMTENMKMHVASDRELNCSQDHGADVEESMRKKPFIAPQLERDGDLNSITGDRNFEWGAVPVS